MFNQASEIGATLERSRGGLASRPSRRMIVVVDDGSTDGTGEAARNSGDRHPASSHRTGEPWTVRGPAARARRGRGRLLPPARQPGRARAGRACASSSAELEDGAPKEVWNGHVEIDTRAAPTPSSGTCSRRRSSRRISPTLARRRSASTDFERFPRGTTCFFAPAGTAHRGVRRVPFGLRRLAACKRRHARDPLARRRASAINISPGFGCRYSSRTQLRCRSSAMPSIAGAVFLDGHGRRESRGFRSWSGSLPGSCMGAWRRVQTSPLVLPARSRRPRAAGAALAVASGGRQATRSPWPGVTPGLRNGSRRGDVAWTRAAASRPRSASPEVILAIYGTTGELIKLMPVLARLQERRVAVHPGLDRTAGQSDPAPARARGTAARGSLARPRCLADGTCAPNRDIPGLGGDRGRGRFVPAPSGLRRRLAGGARKAARPRARRHDDHALRSRYSAGCSGRPSLTSNRACGASTCCIPSPRS